MTPCQGAQILAAIGRRRLAGEPVIASADLFVELACAGVVSYESQLERHLVEMRRAGHLTLIAVATPAEVVVYGRFFVASVAIEAFDALLPELPLATRTLLARYLR